LQGVRKRSPKKNARGVFNVQGYRCRKKHGVVELKPLRKTEGQGENQASLSLHRGGHERTVCSKRRQKKIAVNQVAEKKKKQT